MLTGELPFKGESRLELFEAIESQSPVPPRTLDSRIPKDLEQVCLRCLMKAPDDRYATATELAKELRRVNARTRWTPLVVLQRGMIAAAVAFTFVLYSSFFMPGGDAFAPPKLTASMQINHLRFSDDGQTATDFGPIGERDARVHENDSINFAITFNQPAYFRLLELTSSGRVTSHYESDPSGEPVLSAEFPVERDFDLTLDDGPGSCVFAVIGSREPLDPVTEQELASIGWSTGSHEGVWQYNNGRLFQMVSPDRSQVTKRVAAPELISKACINLDRDDVSVCAIAFPIESNPWREQE